MSPHRRRLPLVVTTSAALVLVVNACAAQDPNGRPAGGPSPTPTDLVSSGPMSPGPNSPSDATPNLVTPVSVDHPHRQPWTRIEPVTGTTDVLIHTALTPGPPCAVLTRVDIAETDKDVTITLWVGKLPGANCNGPQPQVALPVVTRAHLQAPIGNRRLRDGAR